MAYEDVFLTPNPPYVPKNEIRICKGVCFEPNYSDTILWADSNAQMRYIVSCTKQRFENITPFRIMEGAVLVPGPADDYLDCNYLAFTNTDFGTGKWWFGFITQVDFIDMYTSRIHYDVDVIQTFMFDIDLGTGTFAERYHAVNDAIGNNLIPENLELGDYIINDAKRTDKFDSYKIIVAATVDKYGSSVSGGYYNGIYSGLNYLEFDTAEEVNDFIDLMTENNKANSIVAIWMMPKTFVAAKGTNSALTLTFNYQGAYRETLDGYSPKNKKLLTYPYKMLLVSNMAGQSAEYHYEYFADDPGQNAYHFLMVGDYSPTPTIKLVPQSYNGMPPFGLDEYGNAFDYGLTISGFPQCAWITDAYQAYLAQMGSVSALGMTFTGQDLQLGAQVASGIGNLLSANIGGTVSSIFGIAQTLAKQNATRSLPPQANGQTANGALVAMKAKDFLFTDLSIRQDYATRLDKFFTMFGYQQNDVITIGKITNSIYLNSRRNFNYIKTQNALLQGDGEIPPSYAETIQNCFNNGIRFWHNKDEYGNFFADNSIV